MFFVVPQILDTSHLKDESAGPVRSQRLRILLPLGEPEPAAETEGFQRFSYDDLVKRDKANLDIFWLQDESMEDSASLPTPDVIAEEILEDLRAALEQLEEIVGDWGAGKLL